MRNGGIIPGERQRSAPAAQPALRGVRSHAARFATDLATVLACLALALSVFGCSSAQASGSGSPVTDTSAGQTSGPAFQRPSLELSPFDASAAVDSNGALIDASHLAEGYVAVSATSSSRLKFQITNNATGLEYNFDLPNDGTPISCPLTMGDGTYSFTAWENSSGQRYAYLGSVEDQAVTMANEFQPFIRPSVYCNYDADSKSTELANELCADAQNEGEALQAIYDWIVHNIAYDEAKAAELASATGYIPSPDDTVDSGSGICFDYASLAAAMLRSQGIPCKIVTGSVSPDNIYHAWNMVYIDGTWINAAIDVQQNAWTRIDTTFAAGSGSGYVGDGTSYTDQYTY